MYGGVLVVRVSYEPHRHGVIHIFELNLRLRRGGIWAGCLLCCQCHTHVGLICFPRLARRSRIISQSTHRALGRCCADALTYFTIDALNYIITEVSLH